MLQPELAMFPQLWTSLAHGSQPSHRVGGLPFSPGSPVHLFEKEMENKRVFSLAKPLAPAGQALKKHQGGALPHTGDPMARVFVEQTRTTAFSSIFMLNFCSRTI